MNPKNEELIRNYFKAIEGSVPLDRFQHFFHPDVVQYEFPSRLNPNGKARRKQALLEDFEKGKSVISRHVYTIKSLTADGNRVCVETEWIGTLAIQLGSLKPGDTMKADFGVFFRIEQGQIIEQNNYDCIHPW
ncbi:MAG: nuclear transport factor 2 family protein [Fibrobacteria bacterium]